MELGVSMPHSQGLSNNLYPEPNQPNFPASTPIFQASFTYCPPIYALVSLKVSFLQVYLLNF